MNITLTILALALSSKSDDGYQSAIRKLAGQCAGNIMFEADYVVELQQSNGRWNGTITNRDRSNSSLTIYMQNGSNGESVGVTRNGNKIGPAGNLAQNCLGDALIRWAGTAKPSRFKFNVKRSGGDREFDKVKPAYEINVNRMPARPGDHALIFITEKGKVLHIEGGE